MSDRFASLSSEELQEILENRDSSNTKSVIVAAKRILKDYCVAKDLDLTEVEQKSPADLTDFLINFYAEIRKKNGEFYSRSSLVSIRFGLQRHFQSIRNFDIINDSQFKHAGEMFKSVLTLLKQTGKSNVQHKDIICESDLKKLSVSEALSVNTPEGLQFKVFIDIMFYTCRRGRENLRKMKKHDFKIKCDGQGRKYYQNIAKYQTKNHRGDDLNDDDVDSPRIYEIPGTYYL